MKNNFLLIVALSVAFGFFAGIVGEIATKSYFLEDQYVIPFVGDLNLSNLRYANSNLVIRDAKKVVVEQDKKITESVKSSQEVLMGLFVKNKENSKKDFYHFDEKVSQGVIITSDGWVIFSYPKLNESTFKNFVFIDSNKKIYEIEKVLKDKLSSFSFARLEEANSMPIRQFASKEDVTSGKIVLGVDWRNGAEIAHVLKNKDSQIVKSSDKYQDEIILDNELSKELKSLCLFDLSGKIVAVIGEKGNVVPIYELTSIVFSLLDSDEIKRPYLGINYIDLSKVTRDNAENKKGALISKNNLNIAIEKESPAELAGLKEGDLILAVNNKKLDEMTDLSDIIRDYKEGDDIDIYFLRNDKELTVDIKLGSF